MEYNSNHYNGIDCVIEIQKSKIFSSHNIPQVKTWHLNKHDTCYGVFHIISQPMFLEIKWEQNLIIVENKVGIQKSGKPLRWIIKKNTLFFLAKSYRCHVQWSCRISSFLNTIQT
jgi:hypothetical protein